MVLGTAGRAAGLSRALSLSIDYDTLLPAIISAFGSWQCGEMESVSLYNKCIPLHYTILSQSVSSQII